SAASGMLDRKLASAAPRASGLRPVLEARRAWRAPAPLQASRQRRRLPPRAFALPRARGPGALLPRVRPARRAYAPLPAPSSSQPLLRGDDDYRFRRARARAAQPRAALSRAVEPLRPHAASGRARPAAGVPSPGERPD